MVTQTIHFQLQLSLDKDRLNMMHWLLDEVEFNIGCFLYLGLVRLKKTFSDEWDWCWVLGSAIEAQKRIKGLCEWVIEAGSLRRVASESMTTIALISVCVKRGLMHHWNMRASALQLIFVPQPPFGFVVDRSDFSVQKIVQIVIDQQFLRVNAVWKCIASILLR